MSSNETQIDHLVYRYAEYIDCGNLAGAAAMFAPARLTTAIGLISPDDVLDVAQRHHYLRRLYAAHQAYDNQPI